MPTNISLPSRATSSPFDPTGSLAATNVQNAIAELAAETIDLSTNQTVGGVKSFTSPLKANGYYYANNPLNVELFRDISATPNTFTEIGNFYTDNGGITLRLSLVVNSVSFAVAKTYTIATVYSPSDTGWMRLLPDKSNVYLFFNDCDIDIRLITHRTYLRVRRTGTTNTVDPGEAKIRIESTGNTTGTFTDTSATGVDSAVTNELLSGIFTRNGINRINNLTVDTVNTWTSVTFQNSWANFNLGHATAAYRKLPDGTVEVKGLVSKSTTPAPGEVIFTLPVGFRPLELRIFSTLSIDALGRADVESNGNVKMSVGSGGWFSLQTIRFVAEQ